MPIPCVNYTTHVHTRLLPCARSYLFLQATQQLYSYSYKSALLVSYLEGGVEREGGVLMIASCLLKWL